MPVSVCGGCVLHEHVSGCELHMHVELPARAYRNAEGPVPLNLCACQLAQGLLLHAPAFQGKAGQWGA